MTHIPLKRELVEQTLSALTAIRSQLTPTVNGADESCFVIGMRQQVSMGQLSKMIDICDALRSALSVGGLTEVLQAARDEIAWWAGEHGCCAGHEKDVLAKIDAALLAKIGGDRG